MSKLKIIDLYSNTSDNKTNNFINNTRSSLSVSTDLKKTETNFEWLYLMEDTIPYLFNILKNSNRLIVNEEEIVKVELARKITVESVKHLAKHTNLIQNIEDNGDVQPSKILNINKDESFNTYENRLIYTLIENMKNFIAIKKKELVNAAGIKDIKKASFQGRSKVGKEQVSIEVNYTSSLVDNDKVKGEGSVEERVEKLESDINALSNTDVYKFLRKEHVARVIPPIKKTNVILKNTNFQYAMKLWYFLQSHVANDTKIIKSNKNYEDDGILKEYINGTFLLNYLAMDTLSMDYDKEEKVKVINEITDNLIERIVELNADLPVEKLKDKIGEKILVTKYKKEANLSEIQEVFTNHINSYLEKVENINF